VDRIPYPNGLALNEEETFLFLAVTYANAIWRIALDGPVDHPTVGVHIQLSGGLGPDGLALDVDGPLMASKLSGWLAGSTQLCDATAHVIVSERP
jgi:gluconolactonase